MSYRNTMKLFASNFNFVWKQMVYLLICLILLAVCSYTTINPIMSLLKENNISAEFDVFFKSIYSSPNEFALKFSEVVKHILLILANNFSKIYLSLIFAVLLCVILPYVLLKMSIFNLSSIAYQKLTMNMTVKYSQNMLTTFKPALSYALWNVLFEIPFIIFEAALVFVYILFAKTILSALVGLMILSALTIVMQAFKTSLYAQYTGLVVSQQTQNNFKAFAKSFAVITKNFWKNLASSIILYLTLIIVNSFVLVFTFVAGLIISIPATLVLLSFYYMVVHLNTMGQRYYLSDAVIYNPVKHVVKKDDFVTISIPETSNEIEVETINMKKSYRKSRKK